MAEFWEKNLGGQQMTITEENSKQQITNDIKKYFQNLRLIQWYETRLEKLNERLENIENDRNGANFSAELSTDLQAVRYDSVVVQGGQLPSSMMDREIELIYKKLDKEYQSTQAEILDTKMLIRKLEKENEQMEFYFSSLKKEYYEVLKLKFQQGKSMVNVALAMNMSKSTINRMLKEIYTEIKKQIR